jgi:flagellin-like hook-associated protein FlgL
MATESGAQFYDTASAVEVLFNVQFPDTPQQHTNTYNLMDIQVQLNDLVAAGVLKSTPTGKFIPGSVEYTNVATGEKFFFIGPKAHIEPINLGRDGNAIIDTFKANEVNAGGGNNTIQIADSRNHKVTTKGGDDEIGLTGTGKTTLKAGDGNDAVTVVGNSSNNITMGAGNDKVIVDSGTGNNTISTGAGQDYIIIGPNKFGKDTITDFSKKDVLQIMDRNGDGRVDVGDVLSISQVGQNTVIKLAGGETVILKNVNHKHLHEDDDGTFHLT